MYDSRPIAENIEALKQAATIPDVDRRVDEVERLAHQLARDVKRAFRRRIQDTLGVALQEEP